MTGTPKNETKAEKVHDKDKTYPMYLTWGVIFLSGPWAMAVYNTDGSVELSPTSDIHNKVVLTGKDAAIFKKVIGDRRHSG